MTMLDLPLLRTLSAVTAITILLGGCSINGSYTDAGTPDAAKLRFISDMKNVTLSVFDAEHCDGQTTGMLNNLFVANTRRRAEMTIEPPAEAKAYLEVRLNPGHDVYLLANSLGSYSVCTTSFNFTPQKNAEYELTFDEVGSRCRASVKRLSQADGKAIRVPIPVVNKGLPACTGRNAIFPKPIEGLPDTPERTAWIEQIIAESIIEEMKPVPNGGNQVASQKVARAIDERKQQMGFTLPDTYWTEYHQNMTAFENDVLNIKERSLELYRNEYRARLKRLETIELKKLLPDDESANLSKTLASNNRMLQYYYGVSRQVLQETLSDHLARMADLDERYTVCERFANCWKS